MAITNPNLLVGLDTNGTNQGTPDNALITDGYLFQSIPKSGDMNRYFKELYRAIHFQKESGLWQWDNTVSYSSGARIMRNEVIYKSLQDANQGNDPLSTSFWIIDQWRKQTTTHNIATDTDYTLTTAQNEFGRIVITDTGVVLTAARNIIVDNIEKDFIVQNDTLQDLTVKTSAGTGMLVASGTSLILYNDGTNVISNQVVKFGLNEESIVKVDASTIKNQCTAWVSFDSTGNIKDSFNIASVISVSTGLKDITFIEDMDITTYVVLGQGESAPSSIGAIHRGTVGIDNTLKTVSSCRVITAILSNTTEALSNIDANIFFIGGKN